MSMNYLHSKISLHILECHINYCH